MSEREAAPPVPPPPPPREPAVTEHQIAEALQSVLREADAYSTLPGVVEQVETKLGVKLGHKMDFIRSQIHHFLILQQAHAQHNFIIQQQQHHPQMQQQQHNNNVHYAPPLHQTPTQFHPSVAAAASSTNAAPVAHFPPSFTLTRHPHPDYSPTTFRPQQVFTAQPQPRPTQVVNKTASAAAAATDSAPPVKKRRGGPGGLNKLCGVSPELQTIVGQPTLPRTEIVKQLWAYIRKYNLQDPNNKRKIICNDELRLVFETDCTDMFKMNKLLAKHILPLDTSKETAQNSKRPRAEEESGSKVEDPVPIVKISEALSSFFGTDEKEMSQAEVLRQMWEYIKNNKLEDPSNPAAIICDAKLQELLGCESISALGIPQMLAQRHLSKQS